MKIEQVAVEGAVLTVYLRQPAEAMPLAATRPLVLVGRAAAPQRPDPVLSGGDGGALCPPGQLRGPERRP